MGKIGTNILGKTVDKSQMNEKISRRISTLSRTQTEVLKKMSRTEPKTAYDLQTSMNTLYALSKRGLIQRTNYNEPTWFGWERTSYEFVLTKEGLSLILMAQNAGLM